MRSLILAATAALAVLSGVYFYTTNDSTTRFLTKPNDVMLDAWTQWKMQYGKTYGTNSDEEYRKTVFGSNYAKVNRHNTMYGRSYDLGLNFYADLPAEEFVTQYTGFKPQGHPYREKKYVQHSVSSLPASKDWRGSAVTPVKDQGQCGSCWSFSTTGAVEGAYALKHGEIKSFSEQQLVDCATYRWGNNGCHGGLMDHAFNYVEAKGLEAESTYPYRASDNSCKYDAGSVVTTITGYVDVQNSQPQLKAALAQQPVSVAINALPIQLYHSGIFSDWSGCPPNLDHGVLAVGYGSEGGRDYWIVKNSWGGSWGENGYFRLERRDYGESICGITMSASYPQM